MQLLFTLDNDFAFFAVHDFHGRNDSGKQPDRDAFAAADSNRLALKKRRSTAEVVKAYFAVDVELRESAVADEDRLPHRQRISYQHKH